MKYTLERSLVEDKFCEINKSIHKIHIHVQFESLIKQTNGLNPVFDQEFQRCK